MADFIHNHHHHLLLEVKNISKRFASRRENTAISALNDVSFTIERRGSALGILGESGSGKTTLAKIICGLEIPDEGKIFYGGKDVTGRISGIQMIFQNPYASLNSKLKISSQIREAVKARRKYSHHKSIVGRASEILSLVGLNPDEILERFPHQLSTGQRQRVAIARALAAEPDLIIADEAVSSLDVSVQAQILNIFRELKSRTNISLIFISHDALATAYVCDNIMVMKDGKIIEHNGSREIISAPQSQYTRELVGAAAIPVMSL